MTFDVCVYSGVFISRGKEDALVTKNLVVGESVYGEKRISVEVRFSAEQVKTWLVILFVQKD